MKDLDLGNPSDLDTWEAQVRECRLSAILANEDGVDQIAMAHVRIALGLLSQAMAHINLASLAQARGIAESQGS